MALGGGGRLARRGRADLPPFWLAAGAAATVLVVKPSWSMRLPAALQNVLAVGIVIAVAFGVGSSVIPVMVGLRVGLQALSQSFRYGAQVD